MSNSDTVDFVSSDKLKVAQSVIAFMSAILFFVVLSFASVLQTHVEAKRIMHQNMIELEDKIGAATYKACGEYARSATFKEVQDRPSRMRYELDCGTTYSQK